MHSVSKEDQVSSDGAQVGVFVRIVQELCHLQGNKWLYERHVRDAWKAFGRGNLRGNHEAPTPRSRKSEVSIPERVILLDSPLYE